MCLLLKFCICTFIAMLYISHEESYDPHDFADY